MTRAAYYAEHYRLHAERRRAYQREYYASHKNLYRAANAAYKKRNRTVIKVARCLNVTRAEARKMLGDCHE